MAELPEVDRHLRVTVAVCTAAGEVGEWCGEVPAGAHVADALRRAGYDVEEAAGAVGIWGKATALNKPLYDGDRVEVYRPLRVDPKVARRERFARQGARSAGLFARKPAAGS